MSDHGVKSAMVGYLAQDALVYAGRSVAATSGSARASTRLGRRARSRTERLDLNRGEKAGSPSGGQ
jgi:hypothetical protein